MRKLTLFLTLRVFSATGGIEKVSKVAGRAMQEIISDCPGEELAVYSMYDRTDEIDEKYFPAAIFKGFAERKMPFMKAAINRGKNSHQVILSHCNLLLAGFLIKLLSPATRLILIAHGIEVWSPFSFWKRFMLSKCDQILAVSSYTRERMIAVHHIDENKITVVNNCLDPFLQEPLPMGKNKPLLDRYHLTPENIVLLTITRLSSKEQYKGYDNVLRSLDTLKKTYPGIKYLLVGKYDVMEKQRLDQIIHQLRLEDHIIFTGFVPDEELAAHYNIADCYIMPSKKEGFGIVFIEALYYGKPVIAGNLDGSVDALDNGSLGLLVNPDDLDEITGAIEKVLNNAQSHLPNHEVVLIKFSYEVYKENWRKLLEEGVGK